MDTLRQRVFVSSTIYDLADIRSSLRYWLEERGFAPVMSDHNDFGAPNRDSSYASCLQVIDTCSYFVLLIGHRVGGMVDSAARVSITRHEYRHAYDLHKQGKIRIIALVRASLWQIREDRKAIGDYVAYHFELDKGAVASAVRKAPSKFADDADAIFDFVDEVRRAGEMAAAVAKSGPWPSGNWIHPFTSFRDIVEVLESQLNARQPMRSRLVATNLKHELCANLSSLTIASGNAWGYFWNLFKKAREKVTESPEGLTVLSKEDIAHAELMLVLSGAHADALSITLLTEAIQSGEFLEWNPENKSPVVGSLQRKMIELKRTIEVVQSLTSRIDHSITGRLSEMRRTMYTPGCAVSNQDLGMPCALHDRFHNIRCLSEVLYAALSEKEITRPLASSAPFASNRSEIENQHVPIDFMRQHLDDLCQGSTSSAS